MPNMKLVFILLFLALASAHGQQQERVAILNTLDDSESVDFSELAYLTDRLREMAVDVLPKQRYGVMTTESIVAFFGSQERAAKECKAASCLAEIGRKVNADYVAQGRIRKFGEMLSINFELYNTKSGVLVGSFNGNSEDVHGFVAMIDEKAPALFKKMPGLDLEDRRTKEAARLDKERKALEAERRKQAKEQARLDALETKKLEAEEKRREQARLKAYKAERRAVKEAKANELGGIGYQYLYKMPIGVRWSSGGFYNTLSFRTTDFAEWSEEDDYSDIHFYLANPNRIFSDLNNEYRHSGGYTDDAFEWVVGYIWRPFYWLGLFGGSGFRHTNEYRRYDIYNKDYNNKYSFSDTKWVSANELRHNFVYELGLELVFFESLNAYISIRNFSNTGGGIGLIF
jgi:TolB-like protein